MAYNNEGSNKNGKVHFADVYPANHTDADY